MVFSKSDWKIVPGKENTVYERPLGYTELGFYWDGVFKGTADTLRFAEIRVDEGNREAIINPTRITEAWVNLKRRFPLLGARIEERSEDAVFFIVEEQWLKSCQRDEICFSDVSSTEEVTAFVDNIIVNERLLSNGLLARVFVLRNKQKTDNFHLVFYTSHCMTDGMANITVLKSFLEDLSGSPSSANWTLEDRLALAVASEELDPLPDLSASRRRWRVAIAKVIATRRRLKLGGGHTLPRRVTQKTIFTPSHSKVLHCVLPAEASTQIILNCRKRGITFGNAYPILGQVALSRVLLRHYLRGNIDEAEWQFRKREPMISGGPVNFRPFLDKEWIEAGGLTNVCLSISFYFFQLPFLPLGSASNLLPGSAVPDFGSLLSRERFVLRAKIVRHQMNNLLQHPLFFEFTAKANPRTIERMKSPGIQLRREGGPPHDATDDLLSPMQQATGGLVFGNGGSTMGNIDRILPMEYSSEGIKLELVASRTRLRCRPAELYLGATTTRQQLHLHVFWDSNTFDDEIVAEWLEEVKAATEFYLGEEGGR